MDTLICPWESPEWFLFSSNVPFLLPYSHFIAFASAVLLAIFLIKSRQENFGKIFLFLSCLFCFWVVIDWHVWATNKPGVVMFLWSIQILVELMVYLTAVYLTYVFVYKNRPQPVYEIIGLASLLPVIILLPTTLVLKSIDISYCDAQENSFIIFYSYIFEAVCILIILHLLTRALVKTQKYSRAVIALFGVGIISFLLAFISGNIIGSITENWEYAQFGLFGMPFFLGILAYSIIKHKAFDTKIFGAKILVAILILLTTGILFLRTIERVRIVTAITLMFLIFLGWILIKSVEREIGQREKIEFLAKDLELANSKLTDLDQMKSEFLSLASHQMRAPLTAMKGYTSMLIEGEFGTLPPKAEESVKVIMRSNQNLINIVNDFLNISRIEQGKMVYEKTVFQIKDLVKEVVEEHKLNIEKGKLSIKLEIPNNFESEVNADRDKIRQVIGNIIDNSIKYTLNGGITVSLLSDSEKVMIKIKDTGIGIDPNEVGKLFNKFSRSKSANKTNVIGTGLGLYIAQKMSEDQGGKIKVFSEGEGKGSTFTIELPKAKV